MKIFNYSTRSNDGAIHDHFESIESALEYFLADDGYRFDIHFPDGRTLYIHRAEFDEDKQKSTLFNFVNYHKAESKIVYHNPISNHLSNVVQLHFGAVHD